MFGGMEGERRSWGSEFNLKSSRTRMDESWVKRSDTVVTNEKEAARMFKPLLGGL